MVMKGNSPALPFHKDKQAFSIPKGFALASGYSLDVNILRNDRLLKQILFTTANEKLEKNPT